MPDIADQNTVGITATIPVEVPLAAGLRPVDLNNVFVTDPDPFGFISEAEGRGFPANCCSWIKGIYAAARRMGLKRVVGVVQGDCSNTHALMEILEADGIEVIEFNYPYPRNRQALRRSLESFAERMGTNLAEAERQRQRLRGAREALREIDCMTYLAGQVSGEENHRWLIGATDFEGDPEEYERGARAFVEEARSRPPAAEGIRLGYLGIPPICSGLYEFLESVGARVVLNEFQRQFSMPLEAQDLVEQYDRYTYPYGIAGRVDDITAQIGLRRLDGLVHYVQSFCFRHIQDRLLRERLPLPIVTLEYDRPGGLDGRSRTRLEAFVEMMHDGVRA
ncbi:MAG: 2-hydroxyacyl-CoA dehydratase [Planctomycetia bacterium]|nr:2-hydroxyacyl-CoA dehydratase [Planctomycetia bacterium]